MTPGGEYPEMWGLARAGVAPRCGWCLGLGSPVSLAKASSRAPLSASHILCVEYYIYSGICVCCICVCVCVYSGKHVWMEMCVLDGDVSVGVQEQQHKSVGVFRKTCGFLVKSHGLCDSNVVMCVPCCAYTCTHVHAYVCKNTHVPTRY